MELTLKLINKGFSLCDVNSSDFTIYYDISKKCYEKYVNEYFGAWVEEVQIKMNEKSFQNEMKQSCFQKILLNNTTVGFCAFDVKDDKIDNIMIQTLESAQNKGLGSFFLSHITSLANRKNKPVYRYSC